MAPVKLFFLQFPLAGLRWCTLLLLLQRHVLLLLLVLSCCHNLRKQSNNCILASLKECFTQKAPKQTRLRATELKFAFMEKEGGKKGVAHVVSEPRLQGRARGAASTFSVLNEGWIPRLWCAVCWQSGHQSSLSLPEFALIVQIFSPFSRPRPLTAANTVSIIKVLSSSKSGKSREKNKDRPMGRGLFCIAGNRVKSWERHRDKRPDSGNMQRKHLDSVSSKIPAAGTHGSTGHVFLPPRCEAEGAPAVVTLTSSLDTQCPAPPGVFPPFKCERIGQKNVV